ncbi:sigma-70 family RNA polymerase sigma factor [Actinomadura barringtoniae]|uniref:Sigma-70 family RNA polymerase sigma factor n=1 Tax=Actinomadura barringtoniae TaxID=1427535 RepID=A0A939T9Y0_9ACTN|nr:sigma-70 family RNA polymerase sigma factor [Actinomadura barringtoniae]MBO2451882.1 sigma-70 family RNA polymerase sigma factor [Actinomadura barringtoniae]
MALQDDNAYLVARARDGDGAAWAKLVDRYSGLLWSIARSFSLNDADSGDVVQTTWLRLVERIDQIAEPAAVGGWLAVTARRESLRVAQRRGRELPSEIPDSSSPGPEQVAVARERLGRVAAAIHTLPQRCQALLRMFALAPTYADLAAALDMPIGSIGPTRARCLDNLRRKLGQ